MDTGRAVTSSNWRLIMSNEINIENLTKEAIDLPKEERQKFIRERTANNQELIQQATLIIDQIEIENNLEASLASIDVKIGDHIGPYHILDELGDGGMGKVFLVEQKQPVQRRVALKIIKLGMDTKDVLARFEMERQALALMSHPNVASVIDAGVTDSGRPYFVMEYVPGITISEYADQHNLTIKQRIGLVIQACRGVLHAHQKGILHRDLKPGNILVTEKDSEPLVKIIDFGVAKSTQQRLVSETVYTQLGVFIGTPNYTSPEQAGASPLDVDTRTDVYSLGVILYELMVGKLPFDPDTFHNKSLGEVQQIIKEKEAPSPYDRLKAVRFAQKSIAKHRKSSFVELKRIIKGDLSCIIMHSIEKDRVERYASVSALEADLQRFLVGKPVEAQPHTTTYRTKRFIGRHKLMVGSIFSVVTALSVGLVSTLMALQHAEQETTKAQRQSVHALAVSELMREVLLSSNPWKQSFESNITLKKVITDIEKKMDNEELLKAKKFDKVKELGMENSLLWKMRRDISSTYSSMKDYQPSERNLRIAIDLLKEENTEDWLEVVKLEIRLATIMVKQGKIEDAEKLFEASVQKITPPQNQKQASVLLNSADVFLNFNSKINKIQYNKGLLKISEKFFGAESKEYALQLVELAGSYYDSNLSSDFDSGIKASGLAKTIASKLTPPDLNLERRARKILILLLTIRPFADQAIKEAEENLQWSTEKFGEHHLNSFNSQSILINAFVNKGDHKKALLSIKDFESKLSHSEEAKKLLLGQILQLKAYSLISLNQYNDSLAVAKQILQMSKENGIPWQRSYSLELISDNNYFLGDLHQAELNIRKSIEANPNTIDYNKSLTLSKLAYIHLSNNELESALNTANESLSLNPNNEISKSVLAFVDSENNDLDEAIKKFRDAQLQYADNYGTKSEEYKLYLSNLIINLSLSGNKKEALELANTIDTGDSETVYAASIELSIMAAKVASGKAIDPNHAKILFERIDKYWPNNIIQYKYAKKAADFIGIKDSP
jgi:serine/threonine protein kinase